MNLLNDNPEDLKSLMRLKSLSSPSSNLFTTTQTSGSAIVEVDFTSTVSYPRRIFPALLFLPLRHTGE